MFGHAAHDLQPCAQAGHRAHVGGNQAVQGDKALVVNALLLCRSHISLGHCQPCMHECNLHQASSLLIPGWRSWLTAALHAARHCTSRHHATLVAAHLQPAQAVSKLTPSSSHQQCVQAGLPELPRDASAPETARAEVTVRKLLPAAGWLPASARKLLSPKLRCTAWVAVLLT